MIYFTDEMKKKITSESIAYSLGLETSAMPTWCGVIQSRPIARVSVLVALALCLDTTDRCVE